MLKMFLIGAGTGYLMGARAGREHYDKIVAAAEQASQHPKIQQVRGVINRSAAEPFDADPIPAARDSATAPKPAAENAPPQAQPAASGTAT